MSLRVVAIDGPAGAGKSTVAKRVADELGFAYLDTGAMYRCVALSVEDPCDASEAARAAENMQVEFRRGDPQRVLLDGRDVTADIRAAEISERASVVSTYPGVRRALVAKQRELCDKGGVVLEGRDTTTVVCPDAQLKIFLTASIEERARRRWAEQDPSSRQPLVEVMEHIRIRDDRDSRRADSPLTIADDAVVIDTDGLDADQVVAAVLDAWRQSGA